MAVVFGILLLLGWGTLQLAERSQVGQPQASPLAAGPGESLEVLDGPATSDGRFLDPVTREQVDPATAPYQADLYGTTFYFASRSSFDRFREDPLKYVRARVKVNIRLTPQDPSAPDGGPAPAVEGSPGLSAPPASTESAPADPQQWTEPSGPPPPVEAGPAGPEAPVADPGWLPGAASPAPAGPSDDVIVQPVAPSTPTRVPDEGDVILNEDRSPAPAVPPRVLPR